MNEITYVVTAVNAQGHTSTWKYHRSFRTIDQSVEYYHKLVERINKMHYVRQFRIKAISGHAA